MSKVNPLLSNYLSEKQKHSICFRSVPITFLGPSTQYVELNSGALIPCQARASSSAEVSWFKGADKASLSLPNYEPRFDGLRIQRVSLSDDDTFWCRADVSETGESKDYPIQVILVRAYSKEHRWLRMKARDDATIFRKYQLAENRLRRPVRCRETDSYADLRSPWKTRTQIQLVLR